jgi:hypothetical protein
VFAVYHRVLDNAHGTASVLSIFVNVHDLEFLRLLFDGQKIFIVLPFVLEAIHEFAN